MRVPTSVSITRSVVSVRSFVALRANSTSAATQEKPTEWSSAKKFEHIPGPKPFPIIGNAWRFLPGIGTYSGMELSKMFEMFYKNYGNIARFGGIPGRNDMIFLYDPVDVEKIFRNEGAWPIRVGLESFTHYRKVTHKEFFEDAGGLVTTQGEEWGKFRTTVNQPMMQPRVAKNYVGPIDDVAIDFLKRIPMLRDANGEMPSDFLNELYKWALESIAMIALDTRLGCLAPTLAADSESQQMIDNVQIVFDSMFDLEMKLPIWKMISTPTWRRYVKSFDYIRETGMKYVSLAMERLKTMPADSDRELSVLERILARDPNPKVACVMAMDMMMAGIDTTSNAVGYLLYYLAINPEKQKKLHEEIDRVLPNTNQGRITDENLNDLKYLKACSRESMRMSPVAPGNTRTTNKDFVLQGYQVPKGTDVMMSHNMMSMFQENFPKADKFIPERWLKNDPGGNQATHLFASMPFGFGARMCVGRRFAELEIYTLVARILQKYRVEWNHGPMVSETKLLNCCKSPLQYKMIDRK